MRKCKWCGAEIAAGRKAEYCNPRCYNAAWRKANRAEPRPSPLPKLCRTCGKEFIPSTQRRLYCSDECRCAAKPALVVTRPPDLDRTLKELNAYNKAHGTLITYGQWMGGVRA